MAQENKKDLSGLSIPVLAAAALNNSNGGSPELTQLLSLLIQDQLDVRKKAQEKKERQEKSAIQAIADTKRADDARRANCNHLKQDNSTRLVGQRISGTGQIALVCQFCNENFFAPALENQREVPRHLWPSGDEIGG